MNNTKLKLLLVILLLFSIFTLKAQSGVFTAGGDANGDGTISYTIGSVFYHSNNETNGSVSEGVQHPFEIYVVTEIRSESYDIDVYAYPNPTVDVLKISANVEEFETLTLVLYDIEGRVLKEQKIEVSESEIDLSDLPASTYLMKILSKEKEIKVIKIIKK